MSLGAVTGPLQQARERSRHAESLRGATSSSVHGAAATERQPRNGTDLMGMCARPWVRRRAKEKIRGCNVTVYAGGRYNVSSCSFVLVCSYPGTVVKAIPRDASV